MNNRIITAVSVFILFFSFGFQTDDQDKHVRKVSEVEAGARQILAEYKNEKMAGAGYIDVTSAPYLADSTGKKDATAAIQQALKDARDARMVCFLPAGRYLVSKTVTGIQGTVEWDNWPFEGFADPWLQYASFEYPNVLMGPSSGKRATLVLADNCPGFGSPENPTPVVHFWARMEYGEVDKSKPQPNINFNQKIISIDFELGKGNPGAIAINHQGAEGSTIENVRINATDAFAGVQNAPGSGGAIFDVAVTGGRYGFYFRNNLRFRGSQPSPLVASVRLIGQTEEAILFDGRGPLTIVGAIIEGAGIKSDCPLAINTSGALNVVDAVIKPLSGKTALVSNHSVVLENVYIENIESAVRVQNENVLKGNPSGWLHVRRFAVGVTNKTSQWAGDSIRRDDIWIDSKNIQTIYANVANEAPQNPESFLKKHCWPFQFQTGPGSGAVNVKLPPYNAIGDGITDDADAIQKAIDENDHVFLPKGTFAVSKPLVLKSNTKLTGLGNVQTVVTATKNSNVFTDPDHPLPLIETVADKDATTMIGFVKLLVPVRNPCVYALCWRAGRNSVVRNVYPIRESSHPHATAMGHPMVKIENTGGGKWFDNVLLHWWDQGPSYRHLLVENTTEPLAFYMLEPQHGRSQYMVELKNAKNIDVFAMKSECDFGVMKIDECTNFRLFGYAGNGMPHRDYSLFTVLNSSDFIIANINPQHKGPGHYGALGISHDPSTWNILNHSSPSGEVKIKGTQQFAFFMNGKPSF